MQSKLSGRVVLQGVIWINVYNFVLVGSVLVYFKTRTNTNLTKQTQHISHNPFVSYFPEYYNSDVTQWSTISRACDMLYRLQGALRWIQLTVGSEVHPSILWCQFFSTLSMLMSYYQFRRFCNTCELKDRISQMTNIWRRTS